MKVLNPKYPRLSSGDTIQRCTEYMNVVVHLANINTILTQSRHALQSRPELKRVHDLILGDENN